MVVVTEYTATAIQVRPLLLSCSAVLPIAKYSLALSAVVNWVVLEYESSNAAPNYSAAE